MKVGTGRPSMTWPQAVDEALRVGWIDGIRRRVDDERYTIRFTPRKATSHWSDVNIARVAELEAQGRMKPAGRAAFALRTATKSRAASYEQEIPPTLNAADELVFQGTPAAWEYFCTTPPGYRKRMAWWVNSARQQATHDRRLLALIEACAESRRL
ncbi:MAG: bacteriocin-protection protein [Coriobacteriia bacterium]|nr:bacteriocin-protection protein [Coriobacteriia bacterium]